MMRAFDSSQAKEVAAAGSKRTPERKFVLTILHARPGESREVHAREQQECGGGEEDRREYAAG